MSPEPVRGRVIRGGTASRVAALAFPVIETIDGADPPAQPSTSQVPTAVHKPPVDPAELERARLEAAARGYADGLAAGRDEARAEVLAEARRLLDALSEAVERQHERQIRSFDELSHDIVEFAYSAVEAILGRELEVAENPVRDAVCNALRLAPDRASALVLVHPDDVEILSPDDLARGTRTVEIVADASIAPGGCLVRAEDCEIDGRIDAALVRLRAVLQTDRTLA